MTGKKIVLKRIVYISALFLLLNACVGSDLKITPSPNADELLKEKTVLIKDLQIHSGKDGILAFHKGEPFSGVAYTFFANGNEQTKQTYLNGKKEGEWNIWYENGTPLKEGFMRDGKQHGVYREYYSNGNIRSEYEYDMDLKSGIWKGWREDGTQFTIREFKNDTLDGKLVEFNENGEPEKEVLFKKGIEVKK